MKVAFVFLFLSINFFVSAQDCEDGEEEILCWLIPRHTDSTRQGKKLYYENDRVRVFFRSIYYKHWIENTLRKDTLFRTNHKLTEAERKNLELMYQTVTSENDSISVVHFKSLLIDSLKNSVFEPEEMISVDILLNDGNVVIYDKLNKKWVKEFTAWQLPDGRTGYYFSKVRRKMKKKDHFLGDIIN
jgi:hypothetical protein